MLGLRPVRARISNPVSGGQCHLTILAQIKLYVHKGGLKPYLFHSSEIILTIETYKGLNKTQMTFAPDTIGVTTRKEFQKKTMKIIYSSGNYISHNELFFRKLKNVLTFVMTR